MPDKVDLLGEIKSSEVYELFNNPTKEIDREPPTSEVNHTGESLMRFHDLQRMLKMAVLPTSVVGAKRDATSIHELIERVIVVLLAESGQITSEDFKKYFDVLAGMVEGFMSALSSGRFAGVRDVHDLRTECESKAFVKQLKSLLSEKTVEGKEKLFALAKALSSLQTHIFVRAEKTGKLGEDLLSKSQSIVRHLVEMARKGDWKIDEELKQVRELRLV